MSSAIPGSQIPGSGGGVRDIIRQELERMLRGGEFGQILGKANANALAQQGGIGLGIQNVRRGVLWVESQGIGTLTVTAATAGFSALQEPVKGTIVLSGRPLLVVVSGTITGGVGGDIVLSVLLRGAEITGLANGIPGTYAGAQFTMGLTGLWIIPAPTAGTAELEVVADARGANATIYNDITDNRVTLLALEL